ncbi:MAG: phage integrase N-terminal SAM-like domain-containing protein [Candidatus Binatia bacterium]
MPDAARTRHLSRRAENAYVAWVRRYAMSHGKRPPQELGPAEIGQFLTCARLRMKNVGFGAQQLVVRAGKNDRDRVTVLPAIVRARLARERKYPHAGREIGRQWVFPDTRTYRGSDAGGRGGGGAPGHGYAARLRRPELQHSAAEVGSMITATRRIRRGFPHAERRRVSRYAAGVRSYAEPSNYC